MPVSKSKQGKPLGGIGAERQSPRKHSLVIDDRLLSKQYISTKIESYIDNTPYSEAAWDNVTDRAPSMEVVFEKINSLGEVSDVWTKQNDQSDSKIRSNKTGNYGITDNAFDDIDEKLYVEGNIKATENLIALGDAFIGDDLSLNSDASIINFGVNNDVNLTHVHDTGLLLNSSSQLQFGDSGTYIHQSADGILDLVADTEIEINATTIDINGAADISGNLTVAGNLTVTGTATAIETTNTVLNDNIFILNNDATGSASVDAGIEVERGNDDNTRLVWDESADKWSIQPTITAETYYPIINTGDTGTVTNTMLAGSIVNSKLTNDSVTVGSTEIDLGATATTIAGMTKMTLLNSADNCLTITGGDSAATNAAVSINGHLEATTKSFNIPHPLYDKKRLVYGSLEGPEHGMYARGSFDIEDNRRIVAVDLPNYWSNMVYDDYTINLTSYGNYNVWISNRDGSGFWVETNSEGEWSFDWSAIGGRKDAKLVVEPDA